LRPARQKEIDASIARRAATEYLCDDPDEDTKRVRVSGPFTAESLSPHRVLAPEDQDRPATEHAGEQSGTAGELVSVILDSLRKSGMKGTDKAQAIRFDRLEPFSGSAIHEAGEYTAGSKRQRVAGAVGP
jgi:adenine-specific DNA-methyltransferase